MKSQQKGSAHVIIILGLVALLIGSLGFIFWQNFIYEQPAKNAIQVETPASEVVEEKKINSDENYLVLKDWAIRFKLPNDSGEVNSYKESVSNENGLFESYQLSTKRVEELGGRCAPDAVEGPIRLSSISRSDIKRDPNQLASATPANNNEPINGYYYYVSGGQSSCGDDHTDWQSKDNRMTYDLLMQPLAM